MPFEKRRCLLLAVVLMTTANGRHRRFPEGIQKRSTISDQYLVSTLATLIFRLSPTIRGHHKNGKRNGARSDNAFTNRRCLQPSFLKQYMYSQLCPQLPYEVCHTGDHLGRLPLNAG